METFHPFHVRLIIFIVVAIRDIYKLSGAPAGIRHRFLRAFPPIGL